MALIQRLLLTGLIMSLAHCVAGQTLSNPNVRQEGNDVVITYQLQGENSQAFHVSVYSSKDGFTAPLKMVSGDVNAARVKPGSNKMIRWNANVEWGNFAGDVSFELRVVPATPLFSDIKVSSSRVKRKDNIVVDWKEANTAKVELRKGTSTVVLGDQARTGTSLRVPKIKKGEYQLVLSREGEEVQGPLILVRPRISTTTKLIVAGVIVVAIPIYLLTRRRKHLLCRKHQT